MKKLLLISPLLFIYSCANIGTLGGGKVDEQPPVIVKTNITRTQFNSRKIIMEFNEYVILNNPEKNIYIQPRHTTLKFSVIRKKLVITLDSALKENTTYNLIIDKGLSDNNANNVFSYSTTFSTGSSIDSGKIAVSLREYQNLKNLRIALSHNDGSDIFKNFRTEYIFDANRDMIQFDGLNKTSYNLWLFTDDNNDQKPDLFKPINFIKNPVQDSTYKLEPRSWSEPFRIKKAKTDKKFLKIKYTHSIFYKKELDKFFDGLNPDFLYANPDSALINISRNAREINARIKIRIDTIQFINFRSEIREMVQRSTQIIKIKNEYHVSFIKPVYYSEPSAKTSEETTIKTRKLDSFLLYPMNDTSETPDTFYLKNIPVSDYKSLAYLNLKIKHSKDKLYDIVIVKDKTEVIKKYGTDRFENYLEPGTYKILVFENSADQIFDPFKMSPAPSKFYEKEIILKANWEEVLSIVLD